jgi:hypothetical protein
MCASRSQLGVLLAACCLRILLNGHGIQHFLLIDVFVERLLQLDLLLSTQKSTHVAAPTQLLQLLERADLKTHNTQEPTSASETALARSDSKLFRILPCSVAV